MIGVPTFQTSQSPNASTKEIFRVKALLLSKTIDASIAKGMLMSIGHSSQGADNAIQYLQSVGPAYKRRFKIENKYKMEMEIYKYKKSMGKKTKKPKKEGVEKTPVPFKTIKNKTKTKKTEKETKKKTMKKKAKKKGGQHR